jgi:hypothetical protein
MSSISRLILRLVLFTTLLLVSLSAEAQLMGPSWVTLTQSDLAMIKGALAEQIHNRKPGTSASWRNPESGNSGMVTLLKAFARQGRRCEQIEYRLSPPDRTNPSDRFVLTRCVQPDGSWKLSGD